MQLGQHPAPGHVVAHLSDPHLLAAEAKHDGVIDTVPVSGASATCYTADPAPQGRFLSGVDGSHAPTMLHLYDDRVVHTVVPLEAAAEVNGFPAEAAAQVEALTPLERREMLSRKDSPFYAGS